MIILKFLLFIFLSAKQVPLISMKSALKVPSHLTFDKRSNHTLKRTYSPKLWKQNIRDKSKLSIDKSRIDKLHLSTNTIQFFFRGGHNQFVYNRQLKLINKTGTQIGFKIKSNNPQNYQVTPSEQKMNDQSTCQIRIRLYVQTTNISKYWMDKFLVQWGALDNLTNTPIYTQKAYLKVEVTTDLNTIRTQAINHSVTISLKQISYYQQLIDKNKLTICKLDNILTEKEQIPKTWVISWSMGIFFTLISFLIGYLLF